MSTLPRRSPRFQQQSQYTQSSATSIPSFNSFSSQSSSSTSTSHPSPTTDSLSLLNQSTQYPVQLQLPTQFFGFPQGFNNAPQPSPSAVDIDPFQYSTHMMGGDSQIQSNASSYQNTSNQSQNYASQQLQQQHHHNSFSQAQRPNFPPTTTNGVPPGLPADFLAEAAKRAQMACLMRDLDDVSL